MGESLLDRVVSRAFSGGYAKAPGVRLRQRGTLRLQPGKPWLPFEAEQVIRASHSIFRWVAKVRIAPLVKIRIVDAFEHGRGALDVRLWRLLRLAQASGPELDTGELMRYVAELPWCPYAYRDNPDLSFEDTSDSELTVSAGSLAPEHAIRLTVDSEGDVVKAFARARPRLVGEAWTPSAWSGVFSDHVDWGEVRAPRAAAVTWHLEEGPFECFRCELTHLGPLAQESHDARPGGE